MPDLKKMLTLEALSEALPSWLKRSTKPEYNADEIDSTLTTNQFVTATDKDNWDAKGTYSKPSGGIPKSDLSSIVQASLEKADSALQSETDPTVHSWAKQPNKPSYTQDEVPDGSTYKRVSQTEKDAWNGKQNALSTTQMQAVNSGITSEKVTQIDSSLIQIVDDGAKNIYDPLQANSAFASTNTNTITIASGTKSVTFTLNGDNTITVSGATEGTTPTLLLDTGDLSKYSGLKLSGAASASAFLQIEMAGAPYDLYAKDTGTGADITTIPKGNHNFFLRLASNTSFNTPITIKPMICTKPQFDISPDYEPHALGNQYLTPALIEQVDSGAKNQLKLNGTQSSVYGLTVTWDYNNGTVKVNGTVSGTTDPAAYIHLGSWTAPADGYYKLYAENANSTSIFVYNDATWGTSPSSTYDTVRYFSKGTSFGHIYLRVVNGYTVNNVTIKPMICTLADWKVSQKFVSYNTMMAQWTKVEKEYTSTAADTMEYCGISFTVPANQIYEFIVMDRYNAGNPKGLGVADNSTNYNSNSTVIAENMADFSVSGAYPWARQVTGMTVPRGSNTTYYVWVKRGTASKNTIYLMYRRIL